MIQDDAGDSEFWEQVSEKPLHQVKLVMLCMRDHKSNLYAIERLKAINYSGMIAATALFDDELKELNEMGGHSAYNLFSEAGRGFADQVCNILGSCELNPDFILNS